MTRKDYVAIAACIKGTRGFVGAFELPIDRAARNAVDLCAKELADHMAADNPRFDRARFLKACGVQS